VFRLITELSSAKETGVSDQVGGAEVGGSLGENCERSDLLKYVPSDWLAKALLRSKHVLDSG
jgi:hypothetical protein